MSFSVQRSAHLAAVVVEHERCLDHVHERAHLHVARDERRIFENLPKVCLCEQRFALSKFASTQKKILVRANLRVAFLYPVRRYTVNVFIKTKTLSLHII